jgi:hypothetical protein
MSLGKKGWDGELHEVVALEEKDRNRDGIRDTQLRFII